MRAGGGGSALTVWPRKVNEEWTAIRPIRRPRIAAGAGPLPRGDPDRQRPRHHPARARRPRRRPTSSPPRTPATPASSWRSTASAAAGLVPYHDHNGAAQRPRPARRARRGPLGGARLRRRHAARRRPRLAPRHRGHRRRPRRDGGAGRLGAPRGARGGGPADRPLPLRGLPRPAPGRPPPRPRRARRRPGDPRLLRIPAPPRRLPRRHGRRPRRRPAPPRSAASSPSASRRPAARPWPSSAAPLCRAPPSAKGEVVVLAGGPVAAPAARRRARRGARRGARRTDRARRRRRGGGGPRPAAARGLRPGAGARPAVNQFPIRSWPDARRPYVGACSTSAPHFARAHHLGLAAEECAARRYQADGGRVRAARWRCPEGELDLVVELPGEIVFVEVKARRGHADHAAEAVTARQWARIGAAASRYLAEHTDGTDALPLRPRAGRPRRPARAHRERPQLRRLVGLPAPRALGQDVAGQAAGASPHVAQSRRPDGSDRADQHRRRLRPSASWRRRRRAGTGSSTTPPTASPSTRAASPPAAGRSRCAARRATTSPSATRRRSTSPARTWSGCARTRPSTWATSPPPTSSSASTPRTLVVNDPFWVRNYPEKLLVLGFPELTPPTIVARDLATLKAFKARHGDVILKPLYGNGGAGVFRLDPNDRNFTALWELFAGINREPLIAQKFLPAVRRRRQAHHPRRRRGGGRHQPRAARGRDPLEHARRRPAREDRHDRPRPRNLRRASARSCARRGRSSSAST